VAPELLEERAMKTRPSAPPTLPALGAVVLALLVSCGSSEPFCDSADYMWCSGGNVWRGPCQSNEIVFRCARGCIEDGKTAGANTCPVLLCRETLPKSAGASCQDEIDCQPTVATVSATAVENVYLTCDTGTQTCVTTGAPPIADWLKPCSATLIAEVAALNDQARGYDAVFADPGCAEGLCAAHHVAGASCIANACTRGCTGDHDCPRGSTCANAVPAGCSSQSGPAYCQPGGPASIGFTCG
jgi:hypothetical protein